MEELNQDIFNLLDDQPTPARGSLLVAKPTVQDYMFNRTVITIVDHDSENGTMGLIINKLSGFMLHDVLPDAASLDVEIPLYVGGPVHTDMLFILHTLGEQLIPDSLQIGRKLYFGGDYDAMKAYIANGGAIEGHVKFILGYSGWDGGQLEDEIARHDWAVLKHMTVPEVMAPLEEELWQQAVSHFGDKYQLWKNWPRDIHQN